MAYRPLLLKLFDAASLQRWNDQIRLTEFTELDKQAHKMIIAYILGKYEEQRRVQSFDWIEIIEAGIFEFLQRIVLTDLKPELFHRIKTDRRKYEQLNEWVYERIHDIISVVGDDFCQKFKAYLHSPQRNVNRRIISAAHFYSTKWEFDIIAQTTPRVLDVKEIRHDLSFKQKQYSDLKSMQQFIRDKKLRKFADICGQLRFQLRWSHLARIPKTSVLGHMLIVAMVSYLFSLRVNLSKQRCINNYFTGLFHDLPEVLTRDIINPVKRSIEGLKDLIKEYEQQEMQRKIYNLLPHAWRHQMQLYTENEFDEVRDSQGNCIRDGKFIKAIDDLAAFIEAYLTWHNGIRNEVLYNAKQSLIDQYKSAVINDINFGGIYNEFTFESPVQ